MEAHRSNESPTGVGAQSARTPTDQFEVVGVVRDVRDQSLATDPGPAVYFSEAQKPWVQLSFFVRRRWPIAEENDGQRPTKNPGPGTQDPVRGTYFCAGTYVGSFVWLSMFEPYAVTRPLPSVTSTAMRPL